MQTTAARMHQSNCLGNFHDPVPAQLSQPRARSHHDAFSELHRLEQRQHIGTDNLYGADDRQRDAAGNTTGLVIHQGGQDIQAPKVKP